MNRAEHPARGPGKLERAERDRLARVYETYDLDPRYRKIWSSSPATSYMMRRKWESIAAALRAARLDVSRARILDLGAGGGWDCARFRELGAGDGRLVALDILEHRSRQARSSHPWMASIVGDAASLPFTDRSFDLVYQSTMLSSVLDAKRRASILEEVRRVLGRGGIFVSYDVRYPNPWNRNTRPVRAKDLRRAFPGWTMDIRSLTGLPQLLRLVAPISLHACRILETIAPLRSHLLALGRKP